jgi:glyoxylase-like metal-dependent hydrolase (beta-lactamase superfamily II)
VTLPDWQTEFIEVGDRAFAYVQAGGGFCVSNAGLLLTEDGPIAIDALFSPAMTRAFQAAAGAYGSARLLIDTHHHIDHTLGNALFQAPVLAHRRTREEMQRAGLHKERLLTIAPYFADDLAEVGPESIKLPTIVFDAEMSLFDGAREIRLIHVGKAHTAGDTLIYLPADRLLYAGDVAFHYVTPLAAEGHISTWIDVLDRIAAMDVETIVPGHGPVGTKQDLAELRDYFATVREQARAAYDARADAGQATKEIYARLGRFQQWGEAERLYPNIARLYTEFAGTPDTPLPASTTPGMLAFRDEIGGATAR